MLSKQESRRRAKRKAWKESRQAQTSMQTEDATSRRKELSAALCLLLKVCLSLIHGVHDLQYTAMVTINKVIDACVVHRLAHVKRWPWLGRSAVWRRKPASAATTAAGGGARGNHVFIVAAERE
ncbi:hypothetical protein C0J52_23447 [Blattella germanica]|nr:hypothetical protein C0J52_23447 [Blattella germanica]